MTTTYPHNQPHPPMTDPSQPLRDTLSEIDNLRAALAESQRNIKNLACCLAMVQIQSGPIGWEADPLLADKVANAKLRLRWDAWNATEGQGTLAVCLDGSDEPLLSRSDLEPAPAPAEPFPALEALPDPVVEE